MMLPRVCQIATMTRWGGVERVLIDFFTHTDQTQFFHSLLTTSSVDEVMTPIKQMDVLTFEPSRRFHYDPTAILQMARWLRSQNIDIVHARNAVGNAWGNLASLLAGTPVYVSGEHGSVWRIRSLMYWLNRAAYRRAQRIIANSEASKILVCHKYGVDPSKVSVVYNAVAPPERIERQKARAELGVEAEFLVGSVGRLTAAKGYGVFINAARQVLHARSDVKFVIVGGGEQESYLRAHIKDLGIEDKFVLAGWRKDARELLSGFDIFVSTSIHESFGNVLIEAARVGVPVIAPCVDGIPEAVADGISGKLLRPCRSIPKGSTLPSHVVIDGKLSEPLAIDPAELANTILEMIANPTLCRTFGEAGLRRARAICTTEQYINGVQGVYSELIDVRH